MSVEGTPVSFGFALAGERERERNPELRGVAIERAIREVELLLYHNIKTRYIKNTKPPKSNSKPG